MSKQGYFSYDPEGDGYVTHETEDQARSSAEKALEYYRDEAFSDGWPDWMHYVCWGKIIESCQVMHEVPSERPEFDSEVEYALVPVGEDAKP